MDYMRLSHDKYVFIMLRNFFSFLFGFFFFFLFFSPLNAASKIIPFDKWTF